jgi:glycosyltransferase involved in cell wall biosynthesis
MSLPEINRVGVLIINHNYGKWIERAIESARSQRYQNKVFIIVDDASSDNSWDVIRSIVKVEAGDGVSPNIAHIGKIGGTPAVIYKFPQAGGPSRARNAGIRLGKEIFNCTVYSTLDSDDEFLPDRIPETVDRITNGDGVIQCVYSDYIIEDVETGLRTVEYKEPYARETLFRHCCVHSAVTVTYEALAYAGGYREDMRTAEDWMLFLRISEKYLIQHVPKALMLVRNHRSNSTHSVAKATWNENWQKIANYVRAQTA